MLDFLLELIYPNVCGFCKNLDKNSLCKNCETKLKKLDKTKVNIYRNRAFNKHAYIFKYNEKIRDEIIQYKFDGKLYLYKTFTTIILKNEKICEFIKEYDLIIPVPLHKKRLKERGYNQSELIIKEVSKHITNLKVENKILIKTKNNKPQSTLNKKDRVNNIRNAYIVKKKQVVINKKVLLFDDIFTTGNTVNECAKVLKENGVKEVGVFTIAKD